MIAIFRVNSQIDIIYNNELTFISLLSFFHTFKNTLQQKKKGGMIWDCENSLFIASHGIKFIYLELMSRGYHIVFFFVKKMYCFLFYSREIGQSFFKAQLNPFLHVLISNFCLPQLFQLYPSFIFKSIIAQYQKNTRLNQKKIVKFQIAYECPFTTLI